MEAFILCLVLAVVAFAAVCYFIPDAKKMKEKRVAERAEEESRRQLELALLNEELAALDSRYGECTNSMGDHKGPCHVRVYESTGVAVVDGKPIRFTDIIGCRIIDNSTQRTVSTSTVKTKTSTTGMVGRAAVGALVAGPVGAVIGGSTAARKGEMATSETTEITHDYVVCLNIRSLSKPTVYIAAGDDWQLANDLAGLFTSIITMRFGGEDAYDNRVSTETDVIPHEG